MYRSDSGCCICQTKSSSSRFTNSERFAHAFELCFGAGAMQRKGDICNPCVLYVKRFLKLPWDKRIYGKYSDVLDSKAGTGPKHMKKISKRRLAKSAALTSNKKDEAANFGILAKNHDIIENGVGANNSNPNQQEHSSKCFSGESSIFSFDTSCASSIHSNGHNSHSRLLSKGNNTYNNNSNAGVSIAVDGTAPASGSYFTEDSSNSFRIPESRKSDKNVTMNRYRRTASQRPVNLDQLMREILHSNSSDVDIPSDMRIMHNRAYRELCLRNRIVSTTQQQGEDDVSGCSGSWARPNYK